MREDATDALLIITRLVRANDARMHDVRMNAAPSKPGLRELLATPSFMRLWAIGGCVTAMRWYEVLAAALFTLDVTGSGLAVAIVTAARSLPMFVLGAFAGVLSEAVNRKHIMIAGYLFAASASASVAILGALGWAKPWHLGLAALAAGTVWSTEMATRRRMVGEAVTNPLVPRALALDTMSNSLTRLVGPVVAGALYEWGGLTLAFTVSTGVFLFAAFLGSGLHYRQETRHLGLSQVPRDLAEGFSYARANTVIAGVLVVTIAMNLLGFPYSALLPPIGQQLFQVGPILIGVLAAAESFGSLLGGLRLASGDPPGAGRVLMVGGSLLFLGAVALMPLIPWFWPACALLVVAGIGASAFANMQTSLIIMHAPPAMRSRLMGLLTVCIGMGPWGILLVGILAGLFGPLIAIDALMLAGFTSVAWCGLYWKRREKRDVKT
ncbi:MAG: MFS transporter [Acetobacteraceae bacterium]|nr:MFS transporter [Acetobacteraceae bacterium]